MEIFLLVAIVILLLWAINQMANGSRKLQEMQKDLWYLRKDVLGLLEKRAPGAKPEAEPAPVPQIVQPAPPPVVDFPAFQEPPTPKPVVQHAPAPVPVPAPEPKKPAPPKPVAAPVRSEGAFKKWLADNPDLERFIGENLFNKIGIGILVLGIAFFVKYAIDQEWIGEVGRVAIGLFCGALLLAVAHRLRKNYHSFSSVLVGGGLAVFYFTIAFAYHQYKLLGQSQAFAVMVVITAFAILLSILYDRMEIAILATVGGFLVPFLVSNGSGNYIVLFTYLGILNAGLIALAYFKRWRALNFLSFFFTQLIFIGWMIDKSADTGFPYNGAFRFGAVFYAMFLAMNIIHHAARRSRLLGFDFIILLSVNLAWFGEGIYLLQYGGHPEMKGYFTLSLGLINLALAYLFLRRKSIDRNFVYLLLGITLSFLSLTAPIQLKGHYITLFWATEAVVLFWLYQKSFIRLLKISSCIITCLMIISLLMDLGQSYIDVTAAPAIIANKGFMTGIFCAASLLVYYRLARKEGDLYYLGQLTNTSARTTLLTGSLVLFFLAGSLETYDQFFFRFPGSGYEFLYLGLFLSVYSLLLFAYLERKRTPVEPILILLLPLLAFIVYGANIMRTDETEKWVLMHGQYKGYFWGTWMNAFVLLAFSWVAIKHVRSRIQAFNQLLSGFTWALCIALVLLLSVETRQLFVWLSYTDAASIANAEHTYAKAGLSILWGICSFALIATGMSYRYKPLRIIAICLFGGTILKLFIYDITNISPAGKIVAFILLGVLLLIISFMYQRLKKLLLNDSEATGTEQVA